MSYYAVEKRIIHPGFQLCSVGDLHDAHQRGEIWEVQCADHTQDFNTATWNKMGVGCVVVARLRYKSAH